MEGNIVSSIFGLLWNNGPLCIILSQASSAFMALGVRAVSQSISIYAVICIRSVFIMAFVVIMGLLQKVPHLYGPRDHLGLLTWQGITGAAGIMFFTISVKYIPIGDANTLAQGNIVFITFFSWILQLEKVNLIMAGGVMSCLAGDFLVSQPPFLFGHDVQWNLLRIAGIIFALGGALFTGTNLMLIGFIGKAVHPFSIILWQHTLVLLAGIPFLVFDIVRHGSLKFSRLDVLLIAVVVAGSLTRQVFLTRGLQISNAVVGTSVSTIGIVMTYALGLIFLDERISMLAGIGLILVMGGIMIVALGKAKTKGKDDYQPIPDSEVNEA